MMSFVIIPQSEVNYPIYRQKGNTYGYVSLKDISLRTNELADFCHVKVSDFPYFLRKKNPFNIPFEKETFSCKFLNNKSIINYDDKVIISLLDRDYDILFNNKEYNHHFLPKVWFDPYSYYNGFHAAINHKDCLFHFCYWGNKLHILKFSLIKGSIERYYRIPICRTWFLNFFHIQGEEYRSFANAECDGQFLYLFYNKNALVFSLYNPEKFFVVYDFDPLILGNHVITYQDRLYGCHYYSDFNISIASGKLKIGYLNRTIILVIDGLVKTTSQWYQLFDHYFPQIQQLSLNGDYRKNPFSCYPLKD